MSSNDINILADWQWMKPDVIRRFLSFVWSDFHGNHGTENAKSLTYMSLFAVVPLLTMILAILSAFPSFQIFGTQIQDMLLNNLLPSSSSELESYLSEFTEKAKNLTWIGALMLLGSAYLMLVNVERSFNRIWNVTLPRKGIGSFLLYWSILSLSPLLLGVGFAISSYITSLTLFEKFTEVSDVVGASSVVLKVFPTILTATAFTLIYVAVPNCSVKFKHALVGGIVVAMLFILMNWIFTVFISVASIELVYGTFAALPIFLMWLYACWVVILFGANLVKSIPHFRTSTIRQQLHPTLLVLALLHNFWCNHQKGSSVSISKLIDENWPFKDDQLDSCLGLLRKENFIRECGENEYILNRDLDTLTLWDIQNVMPWKMPVGEDLMKSVPAAVAEHLPDIEALQKAFTGVEKASHEEFSTTIAGHFHNARRKAGSD
jgi:membrane protein